MDRTALIDELQGLKVSKRYISKLPTSVDTRNIIHIIFSYVLFLRVYLKDIPSHGESLKIFSDDKLMLCYFEQILDALIMEVYLPEELHALNKYFISHLANERLPTLEQISEDRMRLLRIIFKRLFQKDHPIRKNLFFLDSVPAVRTIRGLR